MKNPLYISAKSRTGLESLKNAIIEKTASKIHDNQPIITKERHYSHLNNASKALDKALEGIESNQYIDLISFEIRCGVENLSEIIGMNISEEILGGIFSTFCVGK